MYEGRPVSLALLSVDLDSCRARNEDTGTARDHRRRGLATLAKLATIRWARDTGSRRSSPTTPSEHGMLAINERLGYRPLLGRQRWVKASGSSAAPAGKCLSVTSCSGSSIAAHARC